MAGRNSRYTNHSLRTNDNTRCDTAGDSTNRSMRGGMDIASLVIPTRSRIESASDDGGGARTSHHGENRSSAHRDGSHSRGDRRTRGHSDRRDRRRSRDSCRALESPVRSPSAARGSKGLSVSVLGDRESRGWAVSARLSVS